MSVRRFTLAAVAVLLAVGARGENAPPRDIWPQAATAAMGGDLAAAARKTNELFATGKANGILYYPSYASSAASLAYVTDRLGKRDIANWSAKAAQQLDPRSPSVSFLLADRARSSGDSARAFQLVLEGFGRVFRDYRTGTLARADMEITLYLAIAILAAIVALALFIMYARPMAHDFREILGQRLRGGAVTVLGFSLLFLPLFLWLGPMWLVLYWFVIFFGYATLPERIAVVVLCLALALLPVAADRAAAVMAGIDNPIVQSTVLSETESYRPEALHRVEELAAVVSDNDVVHLLLGNLQLQEGNEEQAQVQYQRAVEIRDSAGAHVNLGNLHFMNNDFAAAVTEYERAEKLDPRLAIAFYNNSVASGEMYRFDEQGQKLEQAKKIDRSHIERLTQIQPPQKIVIYTPPTEQAWSVSNALARRTAAQTLFATNVFFDPMASALNPLTIASIIALVAAIAVWLVRKKNGFANACIKCGRTFCHRCKSSRESATYCTQCIHIYLKKDGVSLDTKRRKLDDVQKYAAGTVRRNRILATLLPGAAQIVEGRTVAGIAGTFLVTLFVVIAVLVGRLAPAIGPVAETAKLLIRSAAGAIAVISWLILAVPVYRRKQLS